MPEAIARSWGGGARRGSAPAVPSVAQLQLNFMYLSTEFEEEEYDKENVPDTQHPSDWALGSEFVPRQAQQDSGEGVWDHRWVGFANSLSRQCCPMHPTMLSNVVEMRLDASLPAVSGFCLGSSLLGRHWDAALEAKMAASLYSRLPLAV